MEKGTNRSSFFRGEINKYGWVDTGSSFLPSEIISAFLWAQVENISQIQHRRLEIWNLYHDGLKNNKRISLPKIPDYATNNAHMFFIVCENIKFRTALISKLKEENILAVFHYLSLHKSDFYSDAILRGGAAYLLSNDIQIDASISNSLKNTPSIVYGGIGFSWRYDANYKEVRIKIDSGNSNSKINNKADKKAKKDAKQIDTTTTTMQRIITSTCFDTKKRVFCLDTNSTILKLLINFIIF